MKKRRLVVITNFVYTYFFITSYNLEEVYVFTTNTILEFRINSVSSTVLHLIF
jgi:hypothetical protein